MNNRRFYRHMQEVMLGTLIGGYVWLTVNAGIAIFIDP